MYNDQDDLLLQCGDIFKNKFKYYKSNKPKPSLEHVILVNTSDQVTPITIANTEDPRTEILGLQSLKSWETFTFKCHPGLIFIKNPFTTAGQRYWIRKCLETYPRKPNKMNIDNEIDVMDWWKECYRKSESNKQLLNKLRWTTLGYHHNWDTKKYSEDNKAPFPIELAELSDVIAGYLGFNNFKAEAAIVNYYHMDSTLSAHTDHSEVNLEAPLFSFSFGQSAIFLLGGKNKSTEPSAILLNSGDVVIMSKEARLCYHAVPKILPAFTTPWREKDRHIEICDINYLKYLTNQKEIIYEMNKNLENTEWSKFNSYIEESRININVRQVLNEKQNSLSDFSFNDI